MNKQSKALPKPYLKYYNWLREQMEKIEKQPDLGKEDYATAEQMAAANGDLLMKEQSRAFYEGVASVYNLKQELRVAHDLQAFIEQPTLSKISEDEVEKLSKHLSITFGDGTVWDRLKHIHCEYWKRIARWHLEQTAQLRAENERLKVFLLEHIKPMRWQILSMSKFTKAFDDLKL